MKHSLWYLREKQTEPFQNISLIKLLLEVTVYLPCILIKFIYFSHLEIRSNLESSEKIIISKLHLVDLAGSERTKKTGYEG